MPIRAARPIGTWAGPPDDQGQSSRGSRAACSLQGFDRSHDSPRSPMISPSLVISGSAAEAGNPIRARNSARERVSIASISPPNINSNSSLGTSTIVSPDGVRPAARITSHSTSGSSRCRAATYRLNLSMTLLPTSSAKPIMPRYSSVYAVAQRSLKAGYASADVAPSLRYSVAPVLP